MFGSYHNSQAKVWSLYNHVKEKQLHQLTLQEVSAIYAALPDDARQCWLVWRDGWKEWHPISKVSEIIKAAEAIVARHNRKNLPALPNALDRETQADSGNLAYVHRKSERLQIRLGVEVICNGQIFRSHSQDISLGGIRLEHNIPDWVAGYSSVILTHANGDRIEFVCTIVENQKLGDKTRLEFRPSEAMKILEEWLAKFSNQKSA